MTTDQVEVPAALGAVVEQDRGSLPFALLHGEALVTVAAWALGESGVTPVDFTTEWAGLVDSGEPFVLHDSLCPMTPPAFIAECLVRAVAEDTVVAGVRPVTDTVKEVADGRVGGTVDRGSLQVVTSPVVLPASVVAALDDLPSLDFATMVEALQQRFPVALVEAPPQGRRVTTEADVEVLAALGEPRG